MRYLLTALLLLPVLVSAQELHTFKNGEVADADKLNESLQYILNNASGGCSATQQDNSVVIECADGTSGVIAGAGTVVVYPEGITGTVPTGTYNTGDIVVVDANDVVLGVGQAAWSGGYWLADGNIFNDDEQKITGFLPTCRYFFYQSDDCSGLIFTSGLIKVDQTWYVRSDQVETKLLMKSRRLSACYNANGTGYDQTGECEVTETTPNFLGVAGEYTPASEILNAAYPVRLEQLP